jgi:F420-dependent oxidoreductase-like protein
MKLGLGLGYWQGKPPPDTAEAVEAAESLGFDSLWTAEAYGSDALTPLAYWAARTTRLRLGTSIVQMAARTPAATAMAAMTLDHLSGGRFILGLGISGPQVVEGWYGQPFSHPLARTREYVDIVRAVIRREKPVEYHGKYYTLPYPDGTGLGKPLKASIHPLRENLPILLAAEGPKNVALAAEIADGWLAFFYAPRHDVLYREALDEGFSRPGARRSADDFEVVGLVNVIIEDDLERAANQLRPHLALYVGGMGARDQNFHLNVIARLGYEEVARKVQDLYLSGYKDEAIAAIPTRLVEEVAPIGPPDKIREELTIWRNSLLTTLVVSAPVDQLRTIAEIFT